MKTLTYIKTTKDGEIYMHHFGTGWQELVFITHARAIEFAALNDCVYQR